MKKSIKIVSLLLCLVLMLSLVACGGADTATQDPEPAAETPATETPTTETPTAEAPAEESDEKIKLVVLVGWINDLSFYQSTYDGSQRVVTELGDKYDVEVVEMGTDSTVWADAFYDAADNGADMIISLGYQNKEAFETIPLEYPDTKFVLFDQDIDFSVGDLSNVVAITFDSNESGFLSGAAAAYYTNSENGNPDNKVGFVGAMDAVTINNFLIGYAEGVHHINPETEIMTAYVGGFSDTAKAKDLSQAQITSGVDVIFQVAGGAGNGVFEAVKENDALAIGVDSDQSITLAGTGLEGTVMTSSLKRLDTAVFKVCNDYANDPSSVPFGENTIYGLGEDAVGIIYNENLTTAIGEENVAALKELEAKIKDGEIVVSSVVGLSKEEIDAIVAGK